jgi:hypothetical protein
MEILQHDFNDEMKSMTADSLQEGTQLYVSHLSKSPGSGSGHDQEIDSFESRVRPQFDDIRIQ